MVRRVHAEGIRERRNMRLAYEKVPTPPYELAALDKDGNELYRTEYQKSKENAQKEAEKVNCLIEDGKTFEFEGKIADKFVPVETI